MWYHRCSCVRDHRYYSQGTSAQTFGYSDSHAYYTTGLDIILPGHFCLSIVAPVLLDSCPGRWSTPKLVDFVVLIARASSAANSTLARGVGFLPP